MKNHFNFLVVNSSAHRCQPKKKVFVFELYFREYELKSLRELEIGKEFSKFDVLILFRAHYLLKQILPAPEILKDKILRKFIKRAMTLLHEMADR